ncbi:MAG: hypothetical protein QME81_16490 [bacterium]|nr:hypothetical protein [bacterium]
MITFADGSIIYPLDFVIALEMEAAYRGKAVKDLTKGEIMIMINLGPVDPMEIGLKDVLKEEERYPCDYVDTKGIDALMESIKKVDEYKAKEDGKEEEEVRGKWVKSKKKSPDIRKILEEILAKPGAKEGGQKTSGNDPLLKQEGLAGIEQDNLLETNNALLKEDTLSEGKTSILKEYSKTTDYFETNGASFDPNFVDITDEASSLLFIQPKTSTAHYI